MKRLFQSFFSVTKPFGKHTAQTAALPKVLRTQLVEETNGEIL